jgi:hypothetical protein
LTPKETSRTQDHQTSSAFALLEVAHGMWIARSLYAAAKFRIADLLKDGPQSVSELAAATGTHEQSLYKLLRALASIEIFVETESGQFANTALSIYLRSDVPDSQLYLVQLTGEEPLWRPWEAFEYSLRTGKSAFEHTYGTTLWQYLKQSKPETARLFNQAMTDFSRPVNRLIATSYDFSSFTTLVDVGGGQGTLLTTILKAYPALKGILFDLPSVIESASASIEEELRDRCELAAGDFWEAVPSGADAYLFKNVLHDWDDEHCVRLLKNCRQVINPQGRILIVEGVILTETEGTSFNKFQDLHMLVCFEAGERTEADFARLYEAAGFQVASVTRTGTPISIVEGVPV